MQCNTMQYNNNNSNNNNLYYAFIDINGWFYNIVKEHTKIN